jgi:predicted SAM-dependent methyltransferase
MTKPSQLVRKIINKIIAPLGIEIIRSKNRMFELHLYPEAERPKRPRYINIGAGDFYHPFWHNIDTPNDYYADRQKAGIHILHDLTSDQSLPFDDNTIKIAYTSHVIEHICDEDVKHLFREIYRCLQPGGYFRITCPDIDLEYDAFCRRDEQFWKEPTTYGVKVASLEQRFLDHFATALTLTHPVKSGKKLTDADIRELFSKMPKEDALKSIIDQIPSGLKQSHAGDHINWFNYDKLDATLRTANFEKIYESRFGQSQNPLLRNTRLFDSTCPWLSVYVECQK